MSFFWSMCAAIGFVTITGLLVLILVFAWLAFVAPPLEDRRRRRAAIEQLIAETRERPRTKTT